MKFIFRSIALVALVIFSSCGNDDSPSPNEELEPQVINQETIPLEADTVSDNVIIKGGTKEDGMPPIPNKAISLDIANTGKTAYLNEGFELSLSSDAAIIGAYLQFKDENGVIAKNYYDISLTENNLTSKTENLKKIDRTFSGKMGEHTAKDDNEFLLDVDFNSSIEPGTFCYLICVYDNEGNISAPTEVCGTVESWGGNADLVGTWNYTKLELTENGETKTVLAGEYNCDEYSLTCNNGQLTYEYCILTEYQNFTLNEDGTFLYEYNTKNTKLDFEASFPKCEPVYKEESDIIVKLEGHWAYREIESSLSLVFYEQINTIDGEVENKSFGLGEGIVFSDTPIELNDKTLVRITNRDTDEDGIDDYSHKSFSEKAK